jgi:hypothetical protein
MIPTPTREIGGGAYMASLAMYASRGSHTSKTDVCATRTQRNPPEALKGRAKVVSRAPLTPGLLRCAQDRLSPARGEGSRRKVRGILPRARALGYRYLAPSGLGAGNEIILPDPGRWPGLCQAAPLGSGMPTDRGYHAGMTCLRRMRRMRLIIFGRLE